jgi:hypothetical protein
VAPGLPGGTPKGGETLMIFLKWLCDFRFKLKFHFECSFNDKPK